jgi:hypothetical protein
LEHFPNRASLLLDDLLGDLDEDLLCNVDDLVLINIIIVVVHGTPNTILSIINIGSAVFSIAKAR